VEVGNLADSLVARVVKVTEGDETVAIDVDEVPAPAEGDLRLVDPDVLVQVRVVVIDAGVEDGDDVLGAASSDVPGRGGLDVVADFPTILAGVVQPPELSEERIIGNDVGLHRLVEFGREDVRVGPIPGEGLLGGQPRGDRHRLPLFRLRAAVTDEKVRRRGGRQGCAVEKVSFFELFDSKLRPQGAKRAPVGRGSATFPLTHAVSPGDGMSLLRAQRTHRLHGPFLRGIAVLPVEALFRGLPGNQRGWVDLYQLSWWKA